MLEINVDGVYVPAPLVWGVAAFVAFLILERILGRWRFYQLVWHRALFDLSIFAILWSAICAGAYHLAFFGSWMP